MELPLDVETRIREEATRRNMRVETYVSDYFSRHWREGATASTSIEMTESERSELEALNAELPLEFWERYYQLQALARTGTSEVERYESLQLGDQSEEWNVRRLTLLMRMAQRRNISMTEFMRRNQIRHHPIAEELSEQYRAED